MMATVGFYLIFFGVVTLTGGVMGYVKASSKASLVAGGIAGSLLALAGVIARQGTQLGLVLGLVVSILLVGRFGVAFAKTRAMVPAGVMTLLGVIAIVITALALS